MGLAHFYELKRDVTLPPAPASSEDFAAYDAEDFQRDYGLSLADDRREFRCHLSGLHCYACIWLCETAARRLAPQLEVSINLSSGVATLRFHTEQVSLAAVCRLFASIGYKPTALRLGQAAPLSDDLLRLGAAAFCALNTMSFALVDYLAEPGSVDPNLQLMLRGLSWALATLACFYSAAPILRRGAVSLLRGRPGVDTGVAAGLSAAYVFSAWHVMHGEHGGGVVYFDSITAVIALLLTGRFLHRRFLARVERQLGGDLAGTPEYVRRLGPNGEDFVSLSSVRRGDLFRILPGETVPLRGEVASGVSEVSLEPISGEALPVSCGPGEHLRAGSLNCARPLVLRAEEDGLNCYLAEAQQSLQRLMGDKGQLSSLSDRLSGRFFMFSSAAAIATFIYTSLHGDLATAVQRTVALLLVACPCVFGFAVPLALATCGARGMKGGVAFRSQRSIEALAKVRTMLFDKTGTLTLGDPVVIAATPLAELSDNEAGIFGALLRAAAGGSVHHAAKAVGRWVTAVMPPGPTPYPASVSESVGEGIEVVSDGHHLRLGRRAFAAPASVAPGDVFAAIDGRPVQAFRLSDEPRFDAALVLGQLHDLGIESKILSGDRAERVQKLASSLNIASQGELSPAGKLLATACAMQQGPVAMVGNGFNDALAMGKAQVAIAVANAAPAARAAADVALLTPGLRPLVEAVHLSRGAVAAVYRAFAFAGVYNVAAMSLASVGFVSPVVAALLMPVNSFIVTLLATRWGLGERT